ncbi:MAG: SPFH domain-containing protein, partial [Candidatus Diapherotrites archaeon]|nr:SPFH domain-containing protein [Candidatus Diapherotrites archaeon]
MAKRFGKVESHKVKQVLFALVVILVLFLAWLVLSNQDTLVPLVVALAALGMVAVLVSQYDFLLTLKEYERAVIFRFGRVNRVGGPGWTSIIPIVESFKIVDLRTHTLDIPPQSVITSDKVV